MSLFCESSSQPLIIHQTKVQDFTSLIFSHILEQKDGLKISKNEYILHLPHQDDRITNGITTWFCSYQHPELTLKVALELRNLKKTIQKRLPDILNKQFKLIRIAYQKPKVSFSFKLSMLKKPNSSNILQKQIDRIVLIIKQILLRIRQLQNQQQRFQPFVDLYSMRECFQFIRCSRTKSSKISLKSKRNKNVTQVLKLLSTGQVSLNRLQSIYIQGQIKKYEEQKKKIQSALQQSSKNKDKPIDQSILTSIDIINIENENKILFSNQNHQDLLSVLSKALYTFRKELTIHKQSKLERMSNEIFTHTLVKKEKTEKGKDQFQNQIKFLTHLKGCYHPYIAEYYCKLQEWPFKSEALYLKYYGNSLNKIKNTVASEKKLKILYQIARVITFLNYHKICHRDLKLDNVMIDEELNARVIDWGSVCGMHLMQNEPGALKVKDQRLFSTQGYFQRYFEDIYHEPFGKHYTIDEIERGQFFDIYSFGFIIEKVFDLRNSDLSYWLDLELDYLSKKCRQKNPADRLTAVEVQIYLTLLRKKIKKLKDDGLSSPVSSNT